jgi:hypothetical protein
MVGCRIIVIVKTVNIVNVLVINGNQQLSIKNYRLAKE